MQNYQLGEITTHAALRRQLADHFRRVKTDNPKVIDIMLFKGQAEAHEVLAHYTQRHHLVRTRPLPVQRCTPAVLRLQWSAQRFVLTARLAQITRYVAPREAAAAAAANLAAGPKPRSQFFTKCVARKRCVCLQCESATERRPFVGFWSRTIRNSMSRDGEARCSACGAYVQGHKLE